MCLKRVTEDYFRNEGEAWDAWKVGNLPLASLNAKNWTDSLWTSAEYVEEDVTISTAGDNAFTMSELDKARIQWEVLQANNLMDMTYEDYLRTFGMSPAKEVSRSPELIKHVRDWTYPTNTVDPATGVPSSAVSWSIQERADKDRFFKEPGFIFGVTVARPKMYLGRQLNSAASMLNDALSWMPAAYKDAVQLSLRKFAATKGPLGQAGARASKGYFVDLRDLFTYGEQFVDAPVSAGVLAQGDLFAALPTANGPHASDAGHIYNQYPAAADLSKLFIDENKRYVHQDGVVDLAILGTQVDHT